MAALERFLKYVKIDTQSDETTHKTPSTEKQKNLGKLLVEELLELGLDDAQMDKWGNVYAHLKGDVAIYLINKINLSKRENLEIIRVFFFYEHFRDLNGVKV